MRVLGIDPGTRITGYGLIEKVGPQLLHIENGCLVPPAKYSLPQRLEKIYGGLWEVLERFCPDAVALEEVFFAKNVSSSLRLGESRGVALLVATQKKIPIFEYSARTVKQAITGYGQATKDQIQKMVKQLLHLPEVAQEDASDALAVALCHLHSAKLKGILK